MRRIACVIAASLSFGAQGVAGAAQPTPGPGNIPGLDQLNEALRATNSVRPRAAGVKTARDALCPLGCIQVVAPASNAVFQFYRIRRVTFERQARRSGTFNPVAGMAVLGGSADFGPLRIVPGSTSVIDNKPELGFEYYYFPVCNGNADWDGLRPGVRERNTRTTVTLSCRR